MYFLYPTNYDSGVQHLKFSDKRLLKEFNSTFPLLPEPNIIPFAVPLECFSLIYTNYTFSNAY